jgi:hypothetical protein
MPGRKRERRHAVIADAVGRLRAREQALVDVLPPQQQAALAEMLAVLLDSLAATANGGVEVGSHGIEPWTFRV